MRRFLPRKLKNDPPVKEQPHVRSEPSPDKNLKHFRSMPLRLCNHTVDPDVYTNRPGKPFWVGGKERPLREQEILLVKPNVYEIGSLTVEHYRFREELIRKARPRTPPLKQIRTPKQNRKRNLNGELPPLPIISESSKIYKEELNNSNKQREKLVDSDPFQKLPIRLLAPTGSPPNPLKQHQYNSFPVLGSREAVPPGDLLPENRAWNGNRNMYPAVDAESEAPRYPLVHERSAVATATAPTRRLACESNLVNNTSRDSMIIRPVHQRIASNPTLPSQNLRAYMKHGAEGGRVQALNRGGSERRGGYQQSLAPPPPHAQMRPKASKNTLTKPPPVPRAESSYYAETVRSDSESSTQSFADEPTHVRTDPSNQQSITTSSRYSQASAQDTAKQANVRIESYQRLRSTASRYTQSHRDSQASTGSCYSQNTVRDTRIPANPNDTLSNGYKSTLPLKLPLHKLPSTNSLNISTPKRLQPFKNRPNDTVQQLAIYPHIKSDGSVVLMTPKECPPSTRAHHGRKITRTRLNPEPVDYSGVSSNPAYHKDNIGQSSSMGKQIRRPY